ncbi:hypothetical protein JC794_20230 [Morganella morganii]|uniref:glucosamine inositolphosphorylceramide transferase family protein n=1 Tax=Morganella morganii TaxID=582 RepID=UPI000EEF64AD|nr:hypothetical protein [Morganella morganii]QXO76697.1 hypothetical protein JC794_20230 [Morganella morganii]HAE79397.1 hypothetical protein [Morganella sp. (in: enterobacteria)]
MFKYVKSKIKKLFFIEEWNIGVIKCNDINPFNIKNELKTKKITWIKKKYNVQADPFIYEADDKIYIFYEALNLLNSRGTLRCRVLNIDLIEIDDKELSFIDETIDSHLSFPFLYKQKNELYMIPESSEQNSVCSYLCVNFPFMWKKNSQLVMARQLTDNVVILDRDNLFLLSTDLENNIIIHKGQNINGPMDEVFPVINLCNNHSRAAGSSIIFDKKIYIFTQECYPDDYGKSIFIKKINSISDEKYSEELIDNINMINSNLFDGLHTINRSDNYITFDMKTIKFDLFSLPKKIIYRFKKNSRVKKLARGDV